MPRRAETARLHMAGPRGKPRAAASAPAAKVEQQVFSTGLADEQFGATFGLLNGRIAIALVMLAVIAAASVLTAAVEIQGAVLSAAVHQQQHQQQQIVADASAADTDAAAADAAAAAAGLGHGGSI